jgi:hypothetical protein
MSPLKPEDWARSEVSERRRSIFYRKPQFSSRKLMFETPELRERLLSQFSAVLGSQEFQSSIVDYLQN